MAYQAVPSTRTTEPESVSATASVAVMTQREVLQNSEFRKLFIGQNISAFGDGLTNISLILLVNAMAGTTAAVALLAILIGVPQVSIGLLSGVFVDRLDKRNVMIVSDALRAAGC